MTPSMSQAKILKKELKLRDVYAIATGTTLSAGFFLLPGLAVIQVGSALPIAYLLAAAPLIPAIFSILELATAMPKAGGVYYFLDRSLGPLFGTIGGLGTWLVLILKVAFSLVGMGAYIGLFFPNLPITPVAVGLAVLLGVLNLFSAKKSGGLQVLLVFGLLALLAIFTSSGLLDLKANHFSNLFQTGFGSLLSTAGLVYISYVGVTTVTSLSEEIHNPERNLPLGIFLALGSSILIYALGTTVMVGLIPPQEFSGNLTPVAEAAGYSLGPFGKLMMAVAAILAFISVANAGTMSASRFPLAMSRDQMFPALFLKVSKEGTPFLAVTITVTLIVSALVLLDPTKIAKLASTFQLLMFALVCLAVIIMRESQIDSYDPGYRSPFYPYMQIAGMLISAVFIIEMGVWSQLFALGLVAGGSAWYWHYARARTSRNGAVYHIFERLGQLRYDGLDSELRGILKEKGLREEDPFDEIIARSLVIDLDNSTSFEDIVHRVSGGLATRVGREPGDVENQFLERTHLGATPVSCGVALPHIRLENLKHPEMVLVRSRPGIYFDADAPVSAHSGQAQTVFAFFFLISPNDNPAQHLRILAQIATRVEDESFSLNWNRARDEQEVKEAVLHDDNFLSILLRKDSWTADFIGKPLREISIPDGCLVAMLRRSGRIIVPRGNTIFECGDRLTIIGDPGGMANFKSSFMRSQKIQKAAS